MMRRTLVLISTRAQTTRPFLSLPPSPMKLMARPLRNNIATPACALTCGVQEARKPDPHSPLEVDNSDCLNFVSVRNVISVPLRSELNIALLLATLSLLWLPIPPQFLVLNLICDICLSFTPGLHGGGAGFLLWSLMVIENCT